MGTFFTTSRVSAAVSYSALNSGTGRTNSILTTAADEFAILQVNISNFTFGARNTAIGTSSAGSNANTEADTLFQCLLDAGKSLTDQLTSNGYAGQMVQLYIGPSTTLYWGSDSSSGCRLNCHGVKFKNS